MNVTVTGAAGRLGRLVTRVLFEAGFTVRATDVLPREDSPVPVEIANLLDPDVCHGLVKGADAVVHLGNHPGILKGMSSQRVFSENTTNNMNVFQAAADAGVKKILFASSVQAIAADRSEKGPCPFPYLPLDGDIPPQPGNAYALSKHVAETMLAYFARNSAMECIAVRFPLLIHPKVVFRLEDASPNPWEGFAFLHTTDAATLIQACLGARLPGFRIYFAVAAGKVSARPLPELVRDYYPGVPLRRAVGEMECLVDISRITAETGWMPKRNRVTD